MSWFARKALVAIGYLAAFAAIEIFIQQLAVHRFISPQTALGLIMAVAICFIIEVAFKYLGMFAGATMCMSFTVTTISYLVHDPMLKYGLFVLFGLPYIAFCVRELRLLRARGWQPRPIR
jgi:hypothetical protein